MWVASIECRTSAPSAKFTENESTGTSLCTPPGSSQDTARRDFQSGMAADPFRYGGSERGGEPDLDDADVGADRHFGVYVDRAVGARLGDDRVVRRRPGGFGQRENVQHRDLHGE